MDIQMLILSRKIGQSVFIGDDVSVTVVNIGKSSIKIGVEAPMDTPILREEITSKLIIPIDDSRCKNCKWKNI